MPNRLNANLKTLIAGALSDAGGQAYLAARALDQPVAFMGLIGRVLPLQMTGEGGAPLQIDIRWADATPVPSPEPVAIEKDAATAAMAAVFTTNTC